MSIRAFRYDGAALVPCEHVGPRMLLRRVTLATSLYESTLDEQLGGNLVGYPGGLAVLYLPLTECATGDEELNGRHLDALRVALGLATGGQMFPGADDESPEQGRAADTYDAEREPSR